MLLPLLFVGCNDDDAGNEGKDTRTRRTIMVYFNAENNLYKDAATDLNEIVTGSRNLASDCNLLVFFDAMSNPVIYKVSNGQKEVLKNYTTDIDACDKDNMLEVFETMIALSPADEYATVFWGHGDGPVIANAVSSSNSLDVPFGGNEPEAYGADYNSNSEKKSSNTSWIDIPVLASVMKQLPKQKFIFFDACCMQSVEVAYELRDCTEYLIGATCETPSFGAPYNTTTPLFGLGNVEEASKRIVDDYQANSTWTKYQNSYNINNVCMSVIKTEYLDDLLSATQAAYASIGSKPETFVTTFESDGHDATSCIYYYKTLGYRYGYPILYDMNDVMLHSLSADEYTAWRKAFDEVVIYRPATGDIRDTGNSDWFGGDSHSVFGDDLPTMSTANFRSFYLSEDTFGGMSFLIPMNVYNYYTYPNMNTRMYDYEWCSKLY